MGNANTYNRTAVDQAIKASVERIGPRQAALIHRLLQGREVPRRLYVDALREIADGDPGEQNEAADERTQD
jgi:hypothetical protein